MTAARLLEIQRDHSACCAAVAELLEALASALAEIARLTSRPPGVQ